MGGASKHPDADPGVASTNELLFVRTLTLERAEGSQQHGLRQGPNGYNNWAGNTPIQEFVDDYEMMDGTKFDWNNPAHKADPYMNRDPRFYVSILYDGSPWKPRQAELWIRRMKYKQELIMLALLRLLAWIHARVQ